MVSVTSGATEGLFDAILATVNPGDEVVLFEPFFDSYEAAVRIAGGVPRYVLLRPPDGDHPLWWFKPGDLREACSPRTRLIVVNTPHNPTGKVFTQTELEQIRDVAHVHDALVLSDEVYEHIVFPPARHRPPALVDGLQDRTLTVSSAGKSFSLTGWKIGWVIAPAALRNAVQLMHQYVTFSSASPLQTAMATALALPDPYFHELIRSYQAKRDLLAKGLKEAGFTVYPAEGAYFLLVDLEGQGFADDFAFCRHLTTQVGVAAIPPSGFYGAAHRAHGQRLARFAFCKTEPVLSEAVTRLKMPRR